MGKNKKQALNVVENDNETKEQYSSGASGIDYSLPVHSKQAAFSLLYLLMFSIMMFSLPFAAFFGTKHVLEEKFDITGFPNTCCSVLAAVVTVNLIIFLYAILAYNETEYDDNGEIIDQNPKKVAPIKKTDLNKKTK